MLHAAESMPAAHDIWLVPVVPNLYVDAARLGYLLPPPLQQVPLRW